MANDYPIQVIQISERDHLRPRIGGGSKKKFCDVDELLRSTLSNKIRAINQEYYASFQKWPNIPNVCKIELKSTAIAKSHKPSSLLNENTCPIIGDYGLGKLLIRVNLIGLERLDQLLLHGTTQENIANISTLEDISLYSIEDRKAYTENELAHTESTKSYELKMSLFDFKNIDLNKIAKEEFETFLKELKIKKIQSLNYGMNQIIYKLRVFDNQKLSLIYNFPAVKYVSLFPTYKILNSTSIAVGEIDESIFPKPDSSVDYPVVGIIDSGIPKGNKILKDWIVGSQERIIDSETDFEHGSFVGGLVSNCHNLNHTDSRFPFVQSKIIDVRALSLNGIQEDDLKDIVVDAVKTFPNVRIWNLSLGISNPSDSDAFSSLAAYFDEIQDQYNVLFVISAGNYDDFPLREWPTNLSTDIDRVSCPGDSTRALCVGSVAHKDTPSSIVKSEEPSPFSRRGPGPCFIPKPEIVHYGGNCNSSGNFSQVGILSVSAKGKHAENIGTSFSTPIVSSIAAQYPNYLSKDISKELVKALVVHSAILKSPIRSAEEVKYHGFGIPEDPVKFLAGDPYTCSMIFEGELFDKLEFSKHPFPIPDKLRKNGKFNGELIMTLVYSPPTDSSYLAEYCRSNIEVSLGIYDNGTHTGKIPIEPKDISSLYESEQVEHGFKWSPVKVYRKQFPIGCSGDIWRLKLNLQRRYEMNDIDYALQKFVLIVSIRDHMRQRQIYNDVIREMNRLGWNHADLTIQDRIRLRT